MQQYEHFPHTYDEPIADFDVSCQDAFFPFHSLHQSVVCNTEVGNRLLDYSDASVHS